MRYSAADRAAIARGEFFTAAELAARPGLGRSIRDAAATAGGAPRRDPNDAPVSQAARDMAASGGVCACCYEPGDGRSALGEEDAMHDECREAWREEVAARRAGR